MSRTTVRTARRTAVAPLTTGDAELLVSAAADAAERAGVTVSVTVLDAAWATRSPSAGTTGPC